MNDMLSAHKRLLTKQEVARLLDISISTLDRKRKQLEIKEIPLGEHHAGSGRRTVRFDPDEIERWEREHRKSESGHSHAEEQPPERG